MTGTIFIWLVVAVLVVGALISLYTNFFGKTKETKTYTYQDEEYFRTMGIEEDYGQVFQTVLGSLREVNPWFKKVMFDHDYLNEALSITIRLIECKSRRDIFNVIDEEFFRWRGYGSLNPEFYDRVDEVAKRIWSVWEKEVK